MALYATYPAVITPVVSDEVQAPAQSEQQAAFAAAVGH
jgi:hypothetical protein